MKELSTKHTKQTKILKIKANQATTAIDTIVVEEPLEIQLAYYFKGSWQKKSLAVTMRTPGNDEELAQGFLFSEGIIGNQAAIHSIQRLAENSLLIHLTEKVQVDIAQTERHFFATSSCGICGKASIEKLEKISCYFPQASLPKITIAQLQVLPDLMRDTQNIFDQTGGIHAAGLFSPEGDSLLLREDVGRHNALDKLIGASLENGMLPLRNHILMLSGRISFELVQKAMMVGMPIIAAVGAPSSLAIDLAQEAGITLIGFLRGERFNVYCGEERLVIK